NSGKLDANSHNITIHGNFTNSSGTFTHSDQTVTFASTSTGNTITSGGTTFYKLTTNGIGGEWTTQDTLTVANDLTLTNGTLDISGNDLTVNGTFSNDAALKLIGSSSQTVTLAGGMDTDSGIVEYTGTDAYVGLSAGNNYYNLAFSGGGAYILIGDTVEVNGDFTLTSGALSAMSYYKVITIDYEKVDETLTNYPMLFSVTDTDLKTTANGGYVTNSSGYDIIFTDENGTRLSHEIETYIGTTGEFISWVKIPSLSSTENTDVYLYYGQSSITTSLENVTGVWDDNYKGVWHLDEEQAGTGNLDLYQDSTLNNNDGDDYVSTTGQEGQIGGGQQVGGSSDYISVSNIAIGNNWSVGGWFKYPLSANADWNTLFRGTSYHHIIVQRSNMHLGLYKSGFRDSGYVISNLNEGWHHVMAVGSGGNSTNFYVDGSPAGSQVAYQCTDDITTIGNYAGGGQQFGSIDEVRISNTPRTTGWISTTYNNQFSPSTFCNAGSQTSISESYTINIDGTLTLTDGSMTGGTVNTQGNITQAGTFDGGSSRLNFANDALAQTYTIAGGTGPHLYLDSAADLNDSIVFNANGGLYGLTLTTGFSGTAPFTYNGNAITVIDAVTIQAGTLSLGGDATFNGGITVEDGGTLSCTTAGATITIDDADTVTVDSGGTFTLQGALGNLITLQSDTTAAWDLVMNGTYDLDYINVSYSDASSGNTMYAADSTNGGNNINWVFAGATITWDGSSSTDWDVFVNWDLNRQPIEVDDVVIPSGVPNESTLYRTYSIGSLTINSNGIFNLAGYNLAFASSQAVDNSGTFQLQGQETLTNVTNLDTDSGTVEYTGDNTGTTRTIKDFGAGTDYNNLTINDTNGSPNTYNAASDLTLGGTLTLSNGTITHGANTITSAAYSQSDGTFTGGTAAIDINGNLAVSGGIFTSTSGDLNIAGDMNPAAGTFVHNGGTVIFDDVSKVSHLYGTTFSDFTCTTAGKELQFEEGETKTITGTLTLTGE
ncbi:MAG: DUF2341 domain-containing protein, partial [Candidatus Aureabacteria bacterium]|nr:DUF2341 domain-containing protein [Candidatus Auribacterota bacterium]